MIPLYVIYENPKDYPGKFVVRRWACSAGGAVPDQAPVAVVGTIEAARGALHDQMAFNRLRRSSDDDPVIREIWV